MRGGISGAGGGIGPVSAGGSWGGASFLGLILGIGLVGGALIWTWHFINSTRGQFLLVFVFVGLVGLWLVARSPREAADSQEKSLTAHEEEPRSGGRLTHRERRWIRALMFLVGGIVVLGLLNLVVSALTG